jgi:type VI secretion system ImpM family protein
MQTPHQWKWYVWGKHPGMSDFISTGSQAPLFQRFIKWVDNGYSRIIAGDDLKSRYCSWRFWTHGTENDIVCGLVRNSCDSFGRSFPLLYLGTGELEGWTRNCSLLPYAFESAWKSFEYAGAARYHSVQRMNQAMQSLQPPRPDWNEYRQRIFNQPNLHANAEFEEKTDGRNRVFTVACKLPENLPHDLNFCTQVMPQIDQEPLNAVFIGEIDSRIAVAIVDDTLIPADFIWLWSLAKCAPKESD